MALQAKTALHEKPVFVVEDVGRKMGELDREIKYLVNKAKIFRPKAKPEKEKTSKNKTTSSNDTKTDDSKKIKIRKFV